MIDELHKFQCLMALAFFDELPLALLFLAKSFFLVKFCESLWQVIQLENIVVCSTVVELLEFVFLLMKLDDVELVIVLSIKLAIHINVIYRRSGLHWLSKVVIAFSSRCSDKLLFELIVVSRCRIHDY